MKRILLTLSLVVFLGSAFVSANKVYQVNKTSAKFVYVVADEPSATASVKDVKSVKTDSPSPANCDKTKCSDKDGVKKDGCCSGKEKASLDNTKAGCCNKDKACNDTEKK